LWALELTGTRGVFVSFRGRREFRGRPLISRGGIALIYLWPLLRRRRSLHTRLRLLLRWRRGCVLLPRLRLVLPGRELILLMLLYLRLLL
jgi:hypothetical protein